MSINHNLQIKKNVLHHQMGNYHYQPHNLASEQASDVGAVTVT